jgi:hypothetical protein
MHHVGLQNLGNDRGREWIRPLTAYMPRATEDLQIEVAFAEAGGLCAERNQACGDAVGHVTCELECVAFGASDDARGAE